MSNFAAAVHLNLMEQKHRVYSIYPDFFVEFFDKRCEYERKNI